MEINFKVENIVASANLKEELDLYKIARDVPNVEYEPEQFPGAILKLKDPKTSLLLFKNGKLICTGAKSESDVEKAIGLTHEMIKSCIKGKKRATPNLDFEVVNIVASANLAVELDLYNIARTVNNVEYEPEQFPGAILKLKDPKTSLLLFKNGKLICTGARSEADVERSINKAYVLIKSCIKGPIKETPAVETPKQAVRPVRKAIRKPARKVARKPAKRPVKKARKAAKPKVKKKAPKRKAKKTVKKVAKKRTAKKAKKSKKRRR